MMITVRSKHGVQVTKEIFSDMFMLLSKGTLFLVKSASCSASGFRLFRGETEKV